MPAHNSITRRTLLNQTGCGIGSIALSWLLGRDSIAGNDGQPQQVPHFPPRVKRVIHLHMVGAPSQLDLFDHKPILQRHNGELCPQAFLEGKRFAFLRGHPRLMGSPFKFAARSESGLAFSELLPHLGKVVDDIALIRTLRTKEFNHGPAQVLLHTGFARFGRPSMGAWTSYGLGTENDDLPAYVVMITGNVAGAGNSLWGSGFLPSVHQGVEFRSKGDPVLFLSNPQGVDRPDRQRMVRAVGELNRQRGDVIGDPEIATRISQYELAFRMQSAVPELMDLSQETKSTLQSYGAQPGKASFANNCLLARRLVERGVRFVQLFDQGWDHHSGLKSGLVNKCKQVDQPIAALLTDLKQRGLLDETLVVWAAEFGRTPMLQGNPGANVGRDHHREAFCAWMAGGGIAGGRTIGETDELGYFPTTDPVEIHDLQATILHLLGIDHERLTFRFQGRSYRLTDIGGRVLEV